LRDRVGSVKRDVAASPLALLSPSRALYGMSQKIVFNGQEYDSVDAMPPAVRRQYEDVMRLVRGEDGGKVESLVEPGSLSKVVKVTTKVRTRIVVNGKEYHSVDEMPAQVRAAYDRALAQAGGDPSSADGPAALSRQTPTFPPTEEDTSGAFTNTLRRIGPWILLAALVALWLLRK